MALNRSACSPDQGELTQPVFNPVTNQLTGHQMDTQRNTARQFGAQHVIEGLHNGLIRPIDGNGFQHKAHRGVIHEQTGFPGCNHGTAADG